MRLLKVRTPGVLPPAPLPPVPPVVLPAVEPPFPVVELLAVELLFPAVEPPAPEDPGLLHAWTVGSQRASPAFAAHPDQPKRATQATADETTQESRR
jgi:hypothetical protein